MTQRLPSAQEKRQQQQLGPLPEGCLCVELLPELLLFHLKGCAPLAENGHFIRLQGGHMLPHSNGQLFYVAPFLRQLLQGRPQCGQAHIVLPCPHCPEAGQHPHVFVSATVLWDSVLGSSGHSHSHCLDLPPWWPALLTISCSPLSTILLVLTSQPVVLTLSCSLKRAGIFLCPKFPLITS